MQSLQLFRYPIKRLTPEIIIMSCTFEKIGVPATTYSLYKEFV